MSDLDILLASEFSKRHGLYDKNSPNYKDKIYCENAWKEISNQLGYNVNVLKDRLLQLRNRYNVEKRKFDYLRSRNPNAKAPWKLYYHMNFLEGHIRQRKKYSREFYGNIRMPMVQHIIDPQSGRRRGRPPKFLKELKEDQDAHSSVPGLNGVRSVDQSYAMAGDETATSTVIKEEITSNSENSNDENQEHFLNPASLLQQSEEDYQSDDFSTTAAQNPAMSSTMNNITSSTNAAIPNGIVGHNSGPLHSGSQKRRDNLIGKWQRAPCKFQAFGQFVSASLNDMPEEKALQLIQKFTTELVEKMRVEKDQSNQNSNGATPPPQE